MCFYRDHVSISKHGYQPYQGLTRCHSDSANTAKFPIKYAALQYRLSFQGQFFFLSKLILQLSTRCGISVFFSDIHK